MDIIGFLGAILLVVLVAVAVVAGVMSMTIGVIAAEEEDDE